MKKTVAQLMPEEVRTQYNYNLDRQLESIVRPDGSSIYLTYELTKEGYTSSTGKLQKITVPGRGDINLAYDPLSRISSVSDLQNRITFYNYETIGRFETVTYPNGIVETKNFDELGRTVSVVNTRGVDIVSSYNYELDALGNKTRVTEMSGKVTEYSYDVLNRLTLESVTDNGQTSSIGYQHDSVGNRTVRENCDFEGCVSVSFTYDSNDRMTSDGVKTYSYDSNGNMLSDGVNSYAYNYDNRMISAGTTDYIYNTRGIRTAKTFDGETTKYIVDMNMSYPSVVEELDSLNNLTARYEIGEKLISQTKGGNTSFYQYDGFGSTRALADDIGIITDTYDYNSFGVITSQTGSTDNNYLYRNEQYDPETQTYYLRARQYSPTTGRFTQMDSWAGNLNNPITLNKYIYGNGNPVMYNDPSGYFSVMEMNAVNAIRSIHAEMSISSASGMIEAFFNSVENSTDVELEAALNADNNDEVDTLTYIGVATGAVVGGYLVLRFSGLGKIILKKYLETKRLKSLPLLRAEYETYVAGLAKTANIMKKQGKHSEEIARTVHAMRNELKIHFRAFTPPEKVKIFKSRCLKEYQNELGPSIEYLRKKGKTWEEIIEGATRAGGRDLF